MIRRLAVVVAVLLALPSVAGAHAILVRSAPAADALLQRAPAAATLTFDEAVQSAGARIQVIGPDGRDYADGDAAVRGHTVSTPIARGLPDGTSTVLWTVISDDGHRVAGAIAFSVGRRSDAAATSVATARPPGADTAMAIVRALRFAGTTVLVGLLVVALLVWAPTVRRGRERDPGAADAADAAFQPVARWFALLVPPLLGLAYVAGIVVEAWADDIGLADAIGLRQGRIALAAAALALVAWPLLVRGRGRVAAVPVAALALAPGLAGHAGAESLVSVLADWAHVLAAGAWGGGLIVLAIAAPAVLRAVAADARGPLARGVTARFTRVALAALVLLVATGAFAAITLSGSLGTIPETPWGRILIAKVVIVVLAVLAAAISRRTASFARGVRIEAVLIVIAIALTGALTGLAPRPTAVPIDVPFRLDQRIGKRIAEIEIAPARALRDNEVHVIITSQAGRPAADVEDATVTLVGAGEVAVPLTRVEAGHWAGTVRIPSPGRWRVVAHLRIGEFRDETLVGTLTAS